MKSLFARCFAGGPASSPGLEGARDLSDADLGTALEQSGSTARRKLLGVPNLAQQQAAKPTSPEPQGDDDSGSAILSCSGTAARHGIMLGTLCCKRPHHHVSSS
jgi:hypothetical protein